MEDLTGRTTLITGASSGLGRRFAHLFASQGARVVLGARRTELVELECARIREAGGEALAIKMDVTDEHDVQSAFETAQAEFGTVDTIVANAGTNVEGAAIDIDADALDQIFAVNVRGTFLTVREGARRLIAAGPDAASRGRIVIVSSVTATGISPGLALYSASKAAVLQMGRVLARDWARHGINVNILCPGYIATDLNSDWFETQEGQKQISRWPRRRLMDESALDALTVFLASDSCAYSTGSVYTLDDGQML